MLKVLLYRYEMKARNPNNKEKEMNSVFDLLMTSNDLQIESVLTMA